METARTTYEAHNAAGYPRMRSAVRGRTSLSMEAVSHSWKRLELYMKLTTPLTINGCVQQSVDDIVVHGGSKPLMERAKTIYEAHNASGYPRMLSAVRGRTSLSMEAVSHAWEQQELPMKLATLLAIHGCVQQSVDAQRCPSGQQATHGKTKTIYESHNASGYPQKAHNASGYPRSRSAVRGRTS